MTSRNLRWALCFVVLSLLFEMATSFVLGAFSELLTIQVTETRQLLAQEERKDQDLKAGDDIPSSVTTVESPDGRKNVVIYVSACVHFQVDLSGEVINQYRQRIVDLVALKDAYDLWKSYVDAALEAEVALLLFLSGIGLCLELGKPDHITLMD